MTSHQGGLERPVVLFLSYRSYLMALPQTYRFDSMFTKVYSLILFFSWREVSLMGSILNGIQELFWSLALVASLGMGVVTLLPHGLVARVTERVYTTVIRDTWVFTDVDLRNKRNDVKEQIPKVQHRACTLTFNQSFPPTTQTIYLKYALG